jgi:hypothetical protein
LLKTRQIEFKEIRTAAKRVFQPASSQFLNQPITLRRIDSWAMRVLSTNWTLDFDAEENRCVRGLVKVVMLNEREMRITLDSESMSPVRKSGHTSPSESVQRAVLDV